jgi:hypothetical protein
LLVDEHIPTGVAEELRARGHDAVGVAEEPGLRGMRDADLWRVAVEAGRTIVTYDVVGFASLASRSSLDGQPHPGVVLCSSRSYPPTRAGIGRLVAPLEELEAAADVAGFADRLVWLTADEGRPRPGAALRRRGPERRRP